MVNPSTALAGLVAADPPLDVNEAVAVLPRARFVPPGDALTSTPAFWKASTVRALPDRFTWVAELSGWLLLNDTCVLLPSRMLTAPLAEFHDTWARSLTVNARAPLM